MAAHSAGTRAIPPVPNDQPPPAWDQWLRDMAQSLNLISLWVGTASGPSYQAGSGIAIDNSTTPPTISTAVPYLPLTGGTITGPLTISNTVGGGYGGQFALYNAAAGATNPAKYFRISPVGTLELINNAYSVVSFQFTDSGDFNAAGRIYAGGTVFNMNSGAATGAFHMAPNPSGTAYGSFWYNDGTSTYLLLTNNNDALGGYNGLRPFYVINATGQVIMGHGLDLGGPLQLASVGFASQDGTYHHLRDKSGRVAIYLGGTADNENYYQNTVHRFQGIGGATYDYYINSTGIILQNGTAFSGRKTDNTVVSLAFVGTDNTIRIGTQGGMVCYVGNGGSYFQSDGTFRPASNVVLPNNFSLYGLNTAGTPYSLISVTSSNRLSINSSALGVDAYGPWGFGSSLSAADITSLGTNAIFIFADRAAAASGSWGWYATGGIARLWCAGTGDRVTVDSNANVVIAGTYLYGYGGGGAVNAAGGPFLYFDNSYIIAHCGSGNAGFRVQNKDGQYVGGFDGAGWVLGANNNRIAYRDASYTQFQDAAGNLALFLGGGDQSNYYRNAAHRFQGITGGSYAHIIDDTGVILQNGSAFRGTKTDNTVFSVAFVGTDNTIRIGTQGSMPCYVGNGGSSFGTDGTFWPIGNVLPVTNNAYWCGFSTTSWYAVSSYNFVNASDARDKEEIQELPDCLDLIQIISPKRYKFNNGPEHDRDRVHWGFVAQEVGQAMQDAGHDFGGHYISDDEAQSQGLSTNDLVAVLWKACQELTTRVQSMEGKRAL